MGREFSSITLNLSPSARLALGVSPEVGSTINEIKLHGPSDEYNDVTTVFDALNNIASSSTRYTIINIKDESEPQAATRVIAQGLASGNTSGNWSLSSGIGCTIDGFGQGGFEIIPTESIAGSIITFGAGEGVVESVERGDDSFTVNTRDGNKTVFFVITK